MVNESEGSGNSASGTQNQNSNTFSPLSLTLLDPDVFDCPICTEPLSIPVFQCKNGHLLCSTCCIRLENKCPSCSTQIESTRCRPIEKVLESLQMPCHYSPYGCKEILIYSEKRIHENMCKYLPCSCPFFPCNFVGTADDVGMHYDTHVRALNDFCYNCNTCVSMQLCYEYAIYQEFFDKTIFIVRNISQPNGNAFSVSCIGDAHMEKGFSYDLVAGPSSGTCMRLKSTTKIVQGLPTGDPEDLTDCLFVPTDKNRYNEKITLQLWIWKDYEQPAILGKVGST